MYPNNQEPPIPQGIDYLNQIAPPPEPPKKTISTTTKIFLIFMGFAALMSIAIVAVLSTSEDKGPTPIKLVSRMELLQNIATDYQKKMRSSSLQDTNSAFRAVLTTANKSIQQPLVDYGPEASKAKIAESDVKIRQRLDDAFLNYQLDDTYVREIVYMMNDTVLMMKTLLKQTKVSSMKIYLEKTITDFENIQKRFLDLSGSSAESAPTS